MSEEVLWTHRRGRHTAWVWRLVRTGGSWGVYRYELHYRRGRHISRWPVTSAGVEADPSVPPWIARTVTALHRRPSAPVDIIPSAPVDLIPAHEKGTR